MVIEIGVFRWSSWGSASDYDLKKESVDSGGSGWFRNLHADYELRPYKRVSIQEDGSETNVHAEGAENVSASLNSEFTTPLGKISTKIILT